MDNIDKIQCIEIHDPNSNKKMDKETLESFNLYIKSLNKFIKNKFIKNKKMIGIDNSFVGTIYNDNIPNNCKHCSNHPSNGGSGVCHCILGNNIAY
jgi:hypothetical protein